MRRVALSYDSETGVQSDPVSVTRRIVRVGLRFHIKGKDKPIQLMMRNPKKRLGYTNIQ